MVCQQIATRFGFKSNAALKGHKYELFQQKGILLLMKGFKNFFSFVRQTFGLQSRIFFAAFIQIRYFGGQLQHFDTLLSVIFLM